MTDISPNPNPNLRSPVEAQALKEEIAHKNTELHTENDEGLGMYSDEQLRSAHQAWQPGCQTFEQCSLR